MNKQFKTILVLFVVNINLLAQIDNIAFPSKETIHIISKITDSIKNNSYQLIKSSYNFPKKPKQIVVDTNNMSITIVSKSDNPNYNLIYNYDLLENRVNWKINSQGKHIVKYDSLIYLSSVGREFMINRNSGKILWSKDNRYYIGFNKKNCAIGIQYPDNLELIRPTTGQIIWRKTTKDTHGLNDFKFVGDTVLLLAMDGIYKINLLTQSAKYFKMQTSINSTHGNLGGFCISNNITTAIGGPAVSYLLHGKSGKSGLSSNILLVDEQIYLADMSKIYNLNYNSFSKSWSLDFGKKSLGSSYISHRNNAIYIINIGIANKMGTIVKHKEPFIAKINKETGELIFKNEFNLESKIKAIREYQDYFIIVTENCIIQYDLEGTIIKKLKLNNVQQEKYGNFLDFYVIDNTKSTLFEIDSTNCYLIRNSQFIIGTFNAIITLDINLNIMNIYSYNKVGVKIKEYDNLVLLTSEFSDIGFQRKEYSNIIYLVDSKTQKIVNSIKMNDYNIKGDYLIDHNDNNIFLYEIKTATADDI